MNTLNRFMVGVQGEKIVALNPPSMMNKEDALIYAAWIVTLADDDSKFNEVLEAVQQ